MVNCAVCKANKDTTNKIKSFHNFPKNITIRTKWIKFVNKENWYPKAHDVICSDHFDKNDFDRTGQTVRLKANVVPRISAVIASESIDANYTSQNNIIIEEISEPNFQVVLCDRTDEFLHENTIQEENDEMVQQPKKFKISRNIQHDHQYCITESPRSLKRKLLKVIDINSKLKKHCKITNQRVKRLKESIKRTKDLNTILKKQLLIVKGS